MKTIIFFIFLIITNITFSNEPFFYISDSIHESSNITFVSHQNSPNNRLGTYLSMKLDFNPMKNLLKQINRTRTRRLKSRGEAHITVITPIEFFDQLKKFITIKEIEEIAFRKFIQSSFFDITCLGRGTVLLNGIEEETIYLVIKSENLLKIRKKIHNLYKKRANSVGTFEPENYNPHITLGFTKRDLHESDKVIKDERSCEYNLFYY